ncbi:fructokinase [Aurantivibrio plasticivorans]
MTVQFSDTACSIGIDLGGTKIEGVVLERNGNELARRRIATPRGDYRDIIEAICTLVETLRNTTQTTTPVGIGTPGALDNNHQLKNSNTTELIGQPFKRDIEIRLGQSCAIANDANCFALSESVDGAAANSNSCFAIILGTGTGGGFVFNQRLHTGANNIGGEWGHNPLPWPSDDERPGLRCYCGKDGCIETFLSGPGFSKHFAKNTGAQLTAEEIFALADNGDSLALKHVEIYEDRLARALSSVINIADPDCIVVGGGLSKVARLYKAIPALWGRYVFSSDVTTPLRPAQHGDASGVRGAAWLGFELAASQHS